MDRPQHTFTQHLPGTAVTFDMIHIPGGTFTMGVSKDDPDAVDLFGEIGLHEVSLSSFYLCEHAVTQAVFKAVMQGHNPAYFTGDDRPVEQVSWLNAAVFCNQLNEILGMEPCYFADNNFHTPYGETAIGYEFPNEGEVYIRSNAQGYRLPTEAEWEYAARAGEACKYAGSNKLKEVGWFDTNSHRETKPVGLKQPNAFGLYDMSGNVWEWCQDWWTKEYYQECAAKGIVFNPVGPETGSHRVSRGGGWLVDHPQYCRAAYRNRWGPGFRYYNLGFRLCLVSREVGVRTGI
jgi:formylglycine-generating enzyme required for sulfatase activity